MSLLQEKELAYFKCSFVYQKYNTLVLADEDCIAQVSNRVFSFQTTTPVSMLTPVTASPGVRIQRRGTRAPVERGTRAAAMSASAL